MKFVFIAKHRTIWPVAWLCDALGVSRSGFHAWLNRSPSARSRSDEAVGQRVKASFVASDRTYGARRVWRDLLAEGVNCGLHRIERLMRLRALRARPRRRRLPKDEGDRQIATVRRTFWTGSLRPSDRTRSGLPTSPTSGRPRAGSMRRP
jgi:putative transposase